MKNHTRKLLKNSRGSYYLNIPKELIKEFKWRDDQKLTLRKKGKNIIIADWPALKKQNKLGKLKPL